MKKILLGLSLFGLFAYADSDFKGVIENIDDPNKSIVVNGSVIKVLPQTKIEEDSCWLPWDVSKRFADLKMGDLVEVEIMHYDNTLTASKIEIECVRDRAY